MANKIVIRFNWGAFDHASHAPQLLSMYEMPGIPHDPLCVHLIVTGYYEIRWCTCSLCSYYKPQVLGNYWYALSSW